MKEYNFIDYGFKNGYSFYNPRDKNRNVLIENLYTLDELTNIFTYENLPDTIPQRIFEKFLLLNGSALFTQIDGKFYILTGAGGGYLNYNYDFTQFVFSNPYLQKSGMYDIENEPTTKDYNLYSNGDGILIRNDSFSVGVFPLINKYNSLIADIDLTIYSVVVGLRSQALLTASSLKAKNAVDEWYKKLEDGSPVCVLDNSAFDGDTEVKAQPLTQSSVNLLSQLIEIRQYMLATRNNKLGVNSNFNMKREALSTAECTLNDQSIIPLVLDMFENRLTAVKKINEKYNLNIVVKLNNLWAENVNSVNDTDEKNEEREESKNVEE